MKKIILILPLITIALTACSKPNTDTPENNQAPENTITQTESMQPTTTQPATPMGDTAETSLDWAGKYKGVFPCADCQGIETELELKTDKTYELTQKYLGKGKNNESKVKGTFSFDPDNPSVIRLDKAGENRKFFVGENFVEARDINTGKMIDSKLNYKLQKDLN
ncbi:copper homeostasis protein CutF [Acinetobacter sp. SFB]|uniref:copper resistance protein NlpE n=1 Tax=Acinetobacter sp. SFB TaxID=1805634 RepID=UPI0007D83B9C|nr:copper resistance protein NlpE [Acinetobacter sp. SFB]OAL81358.1 copper homeostasis protein CutF [Acinetobacter sp. SFB]